MIYITEDQVQSVLKVSECIELLREAFAQPYVNIPRYRLKSNRSLLHVMSASIPALEVMGLKAYGTSRSGSGFGVLLYREDTGKLLCTMEADALGQIRTGAASGLATDLLARRDSRVGAMIGTGYQAETQLLAIDSVREFDEVRVFSRSAENRQRFVSRMQERVRAKVLDVPTCEECVRDADVICTITNSRIPILEGSWLSKGCHINAAGSNSLSRKELDQEALRRCDLICVDDLQQSRIESGDLEPLTEQEWQSVVELRDVVRGKSARSSEDQITLFKSNGIAVEDVAAARRVYQLLGHEF